MKPRRFEYRLIWAYQGSKTRKVVLAQQPSRILKRLRRLATTEPWMGATITALRKSWNHLKLKQELQWEDVAGLGIREVMLQIQRSYPDLDFIRVEFRQVGDWVQMLEPEHRLRTPTTNASDERQLALLARIEAMPPDELDNWRLLPPDCRGDMRPSTQRRKHSHGKRAMDRWASGLKGIAAAAPGDGNPS